MSVHKRSRSLEPFNKMEEHGCGRVHYGATTSDDSVTCKGPSSVLTAAQCSTVSVYLVKINGVPRLVTATWNKNIINQSFTVSIDRPNASASCGGGPDDGPLSHKVELKPWPFWSKKGFKTLAVDGDRLDIFWDLRAAKFAPSSPEPACGYYVALVIHEEVVLLLGDCNKDAYKRTKSRPSLEDAVPVCRRESVFGKRSFAARARLDAGRKEHEIVVESALAGPREPEMSITVDGAPLVHVKNLQWKFRGNETVLVGQAPVQVFWDVHDWIFAGPGAQAVFIFKPGAPPEVREEEDGEGGWDGSVVEGDYSFFLYAWRME